MSLTQLLNQQLRADLNKGLIDGFTPASLNSTVHWFDATDLSTLTGATPVTAFADKIGSLSLDHATLGPDSGTRTLNGRNVLDFVNGEYLAESSWTHPATSHIFWAGEIDSIDNASDAIWSHESPTSFDYQIDASHGTQFDGRMNGSFIWTNQTFTGGPYSGAVLIELALDDAGSTATVYVNGTQVAQATDYVGLNTTGILGLMANRTPNRFVDGSIMHFAICNSVLSGGDLANMRGFFNNELGI
jgi:hypothetical protein